MPDQRIKVDDALAGQALAGVLKVRLAGQSWGSAKKLIANRHVQVNGNLCVDDARRVKAGDVVHVFDHPRAAPATAEQIRIIFRDPHLVIVDKPAGVTTLRHAEERQWPRQRKDRMPTLDELVQRALAIQLGRQPSPRQTPARRDPRRRGPQPRRFAPPPYRMKIPRVRAVHRLDRDTSGLMVFALTPQAEQALIRQFKQHDIDRVYRAVVHGHLEDARTIESWFVRDRGDGLRGSSPLGRDAPNSQRALTHVRPIERIGDYTLVECRLETGRTHQIRIHLSEMGHRLCGEKMYTHALGEPPAPDPSGAPRQALHSGKIRFVHPITGQPMQFQSDFPPELAKWIKQLRRR